MAWGYGDRSIWRWAAVLATVCVLSAIGSRRIDMATASGVYIPVGDDSERWFSFDNLREAAGGSVLPKAERRERSDGLPYPSGGVGAVPVLEYPFSGIDLYVAPDGRVFGATVYRAESPGPGGWPRGPALYGEVVPGAGAFGYRVGQRCGLGSDLPAYWGVATLGSDHNDRLYWRMYRDKLGKAIQALGLQVHDGIITCITVMGPFHTPERSYYGQTASAAIGEYGPPIPTCYLYGTPQRRSDGVLVAAFLVFGVVAGWLARVHDGVESRGSQARGAAVRLLVGAGGCAACMALALRFAGESNGTLFYFSTVSGQFRVALLLVSAIVGGSTGLFSWILRRRSRIAVWGVCTALGAGLSVVSAAWHPSDLMNGPFRLGDAVWALVGFAVYASAFAATSIRRPTPTPTEARLEAATETD